MCFKKGIGEDKRVFVIYSPMKVLGNMDFPLLGLVNGDCNPNLPETGNYLVSACLDGGFLSGRHYNQDSKSIEVIASAEKPLAAGSVDSGPVILNSKSVPVGC